MSKTAQLAVLFVLIGCMNAAPPPQKPVQTTSNEPRVVFPDHFVVRVEIASDDATREQGLMYRDQLAADHGMIFLFPKAGNYPFWMKNTIIPLDMIWIDDQKKIVHVERNVPPCKADPCPSYDPAAFASYVLETAAGVAGRHGLEKGQTLRFEGMDNVVVR